MMTPLETYQLDWAKDGDIKVDALDEASRNVPLLHAKWWKHYSAERLKFKKLTLEYKKLYRLRWEYWSGKLDDAERVAQEWPPQPLKILSANLSMYLDSDTVLEPLQLRLALQEETCKFLEDVIKSINWRANTIKNMIDFLRFKMGT